MSHVPSLFALMAIHLLAVASPGPAFVSTIQVSARHSRQSGVFHAVGLGLAVLAWALGAMLGLQALMVRMVWLYRVLQFAGGAYLMYLGIMAWRHAKNPLPEQTLEGQPLTPAQAFRRGFSINISNPKVMVFFASIFAAFLHPDWPLWVRLAALGIVAADETVWNMALSLLLSTKPAQAAYRRAKANIDRAAGVFMTLFGGRLIWNATRLASAG